MTGSSADFAVDADLTAVRLDDPLRDGEPEAHAASDSSAIRVPGLPVAVEDVLQPRGRDPGPRVRHGETDVRDKQPRRHPRPSARQGHRDRGVAALALGRNRSPRRRGPSGRHDLRLSWTGPLNHPMSSPIPAHRWRILPRETSSLDLHDGIVRTADSRAEEVMTVEGRCEICRTPSKAVSTPIPGSRQRVVLCSLLCESTYRRLHAERQAVKNETRRGSRERRRSAAVE